MHGGFDVRKKTTQFHFLKNEMHEFELIQMMHELEGQILFLRRRFKDLNNIRLLHNPTIFVIMMVFLNNMKL